MEEKSKKGDKRYEKEKVHADVLSKSIIHAVDIIVVMGQALSPIYLHKVDFA